MQEVISMFLHRKKTHIQNSIQFNRYVGHMQCCHSQFKRQPNNRQYKKKKKNEKKKKKKQKKKKQSDSTDTQYSVLSVNGEWIWKKSIQ